MQAADVVPESTSFRKHAFTRWGHRVGSLTEIPALLRSLGADPEPILADAGLTPLSLAQPEYRIDFGALGRLMACGAEATGHPQFGLLVGRAASLSRMGLLGELARNCATLGEALELLTTHQQMHSSGALTFMLKRAPVVDLGYAVYYPGVDAIPHLAEAALATSFNCVRELVGPGWRPTEVLLAHARPASTLLHRQFFGVEPRFDCDISAMRFPEHWLARPIHDAKPERKRVALARAEAMSPSIVLRAYRGLRVLLIQGKCSGDDLAQRLAMHRRTLNRRLRQSGTTFQAILDDVRFEVGRQLLTYTEMGMDDIAASLGYASPSAFMRAFRRVAGVTPRWWRRYASSARTIGEPWSSSTRAVENCEDARERLH